MLRNSGAFYLRLHSSHSMVSALFSALSVFLSRLEQQLEGEGLVSSGSLSASAAAQGASWKGFSLGQ